MPLVPVLTKKGGLNFQDSETGAYVHSQYDPFKEIERGLSNLTTEEILVCLGMGAGYVLELVSQKKVYSHLRSIYIWEPEISLLDSGEIKKKFNHFLSGLGYRVNL